MSAEELRNDLLSSETGKGDKLLTVNQPAQYAVSRTQHEKNYDIISLKDFGAKANGNDDSVYIQNAVRNGGCLLIPDGQYTSLSKIIIDHSASNYPVMGRHSTRLDFAGSSLTNTTFNTRGNDFLEYIGNTTGSAQGVHSGMTFRDFTVYGEENQGAALRVTSAAYLKLSDINVVRCNAGAVLTGVLTSEIDRMIVQYCNYGMYINTGLNSTANALTINGVFSGNNKAGIEGEIGTSLTIKNSNFEGNGRYVTDVSGTRGIYLRAKEPMSVINIDNCYFEANAGVADIQIDNMTSSPLIINITGCVFVRGNSEGGYCTSVIKCTSPGGGKIILNINGCHFYTQTAFGYVPSPDKPFISPLNGLLRVTGMDTCYFSENNSFSPTLYGSSSVIAGNVTATGVSNCPDYITVTKTSTGLYTLTSAIPFGASNNDWSIFAQTKAADTKITHAVTINQVSAEIKTSDSSGTKKDAPFSFLITRQKGI